MYVTYEFFIKISILYIIFFVTKFPFWGGVDGGRPLCFGMCDGVMYDRNVYFVICVTTAKFCRSLICFCGDNRWYNFLEFWESDISSHDTNQYYKK